MAARISAHLCFIMASQDVDALRYQLANCHNEAQIAASLHTHEMHEAARRLRETEDRVRTLEADHEFWFGKIEQAEKRVAEVRAGFEAERGALQGSIRELRHEVEVLTEACGETEAELETVRRERDANARRHERDVAVLKEQVAMLEKQSRVGGGRAVPAETPEPAGTLAAAATPTPPAFVTSDIAQQLRLVQQHETTIAALRRDNVALQAQLESQSVLREQNRELRAAVDKTEALRAQLDEAELTKLELQQQLLRDTRTNTVAELRAANSVLTDAANVALAKTTELQQQVESLTTELEAARASNQLLTLRHDKLERQRVLSLQEIELLRQQLVEYDEMMGDKSKAPGASAAAYQSIIDGYKQEVARQLEVPATVAAAAKRPRSDSPAPSAVAELSRLASENESLKAQLATREQIHALRVLAHRDSPYARDQAVKRRQLEALRAENEALRQQAGGTTPATVALATYERMLVDLNQLETKVYELEKRTTRLREAYGRQAREFSATVALIFGWRLEFVLLHHVRLESSTNPGHTLAVDPYKRTLKVGPGMDRTVCEELVREYVTAGAVAPFFAKLTLMEEPEEAGAYDVTWG